MGNKEKFTREQIVTAMWNTGAIVMDMAKQLNTSTKVIYEYFHRYPDILHEKKMVEAATLDLAESGLLRALKNREPWAIRMYLYTKGKHLGYTTRIEVDEKPIEKPILKGSVDYKKLPTDVLRKIIESTIQDEESEDEEAA